ncbi:alpha/beta hydrolase fold domain-containing protein [Cellulomonas oligotrophica]|uniref:Acetyl esterase/lipase n=1 Tax=Cellulomonas oligotrophica TaxID=931536 RepID=A0A7Y9FIP4_9CELL|nr:alpha/beta hydrolase fold domain-containing protein [Cellulomonas oligotrophica]NYD87868.1 acetyl esterase/lipase [Cellulomonas oligotrophica]GIG32925.1 carboxylesterase [Cellulomonas oligotrophica]
MRLLTVPAVADTIARLMQRGPGPRVPDEIAFAEIPATTTAVTVPTRHGDAPAVVYAPPGGVEGAPVHVNLHGGGFALGHPEQDDPWCRYLAHEAGVVVVNVDYALAPQHRFPVAVEQAYDALAWAALDGHGWDGSRLTVGGHSAGGAAATAAARQALAAGTPRVALQVLQYPPLDLVTPGGRKHAAGRSIISVPMTQVFDTAYVPTRAAKEHPLASPAWDGDTADLTGIAPAVVVTCALDRLHDEGVRYADRLAAAGALVEHVDLPDQDHGYTVLTRDRAVVERVYALLARHVRTAVG